MRFLKAVAVFGLSVCFSHSSFALDPEIGEVPKALSNIEYLDGTKVSLEALRGSPLVIYFGADWCGPCRLRGRPALIEAMKKYKSQGLQAIFVSMDDNNLREAKVRESKAIDIPIAMARLDLCAPWKCNDGLRDQGEFGRIYSYPTAVVLDASGVVRAKHSGGSGVQDNLNKSIEKVLFK